MAWEISGAGTVTFDDLTTPHGHHSELQGGSAVYFGIAAARYCRTHLIGVVGRDGEASARAALAGTGIDLDGLEVADGPTFRWRATQDFETWVTSSEASRPGVYLTWRPKVPPAAAAAPVLFLGSMAPAQQMAVIRQSDARLIGADSMLLFIHAEREAFMEVALAADILFLNRAEFCALSGASEERWTDAAQGLCGQGRLRLVVVKAGPLGAVCVSRDGIIEQDAHPVMVVDPTGAGDAFAGGFLGACAVAERDPLDHLQAALDAGLRCAAAAISTFGTLGLLAHAPA